MTPDEIAAAKKMAADLASGYSARLPHRDEMVRTIERLCDEVERLQKYEPDMRPRINVCNGYPWPGGGKSHDD